MKNAQEIIEVVNAAHGNAVAKGWWEKERTLPELVALIHSEASEALEDFRNGKGLNEVWYEYTCGVIGEFESTSHTGYVMVDGVLTETLGKPCGIPSELADIVIRVYDLVGKHDETMGFSNRLWALEMVGSAPVVHTDKSFGDNMGWLHYSISEILRVFDYSAEVVYNTYKLAEYSGIDLDAIIAEKMAYNATRPHRHGGKVL